MSAARREVEGEDVRSGREDPSNPGRSRKRCNTKCGAQD
jgi:hypothetical protein